MDLICKMIILYKIANKMYDLKKYFFYPRIIFIKKFKKLNFEKSHFGNFLEFLKNAFFLKVNVLKKSKFQENAFHF